MTNRTAEDALFELVLYIAASARLTLDETTTYGSFRLIEAAGRLLEAAGREWNVTLDDILAETRTRIESDKLLWLSGADPYKEFLSDVVLRLTAEATRRNLQTDQ